VILPKKNELDLMEDLPKELRDQMKFVFVTDIPQVLETAIEDFSLKASTSEPRIVENGHQRPRRRKGEKAAAKA
jgi:ATP-dependent Lon protease